jgi:hypothetical protein
MVVHRVLGNRYLIAESNRNSDALVYRNSTNQDSRSEKYLGFAFTLAIRPPGVIHLKLRPEIMEDPIYCKAVFQATGIPSR